MGSNPTQVVSLNDQEIGMHTGSTPGSGERIPVQAGERWFKGNQGCWHLGPGLAAFKTWKNKLSFGHTVHDAMLRQLLPTNTKIQKIR